ncbi:hypothetical protein AAY473_023958 [Plecturocebus cupreus]
MESKEGHLLHRTEVPSFHKETFPLYFEACQATHSGIAYSAPVCVGQELLHLVPLGLRNRTAGTAQHGPLLSTLNSSIRNQLHLLKCQQSQIVKRKPAILQSLLS